MASTLPVGSEQQAIIAIAVLAAVFPVTVVVLRLLARRVSNRPLNTSDYIIIPACVCTIVYQSILITSVLTVGTGHHLTDVVDVLGPEKLVEFLKILFTLQLLYTVTISLTKLSILELYRLIFPSTTMLYACVATQAVVVMWAFATIFLTLFICQPIAYNWDLSIPDAKCGDTLASWKSTGIVNIITDILVLVLPIPALARVQMALYKKLVVIATFTLGVFTTAVGIARLDAIIHVDQTDITYSVAWAIVFSALECSVAITLSCIPLLRPLLARNDYIKSGTPRAQSTWIGGCRSTSGKSKDTFQRMDDNSSALELQPRGAFHKAGIVPNNNTDASGSLKSDAGGANDIMVHHEWDVTMQER